MAAPRAINRRFTVLHVLVIGLMLLVVPPVWAAPDHFRIIRDTESELALGVLAKPLREAAGLETRSNLDCPKSGT